MAAGIEGGKTKPRGFAAGPREEQHHVAFGSYAYLIAVLQGGTGSDALKWHGRPKL